MSYLEREHPAENHSGTTEPRCSARAAQQQNIFAGCSKRPFSKAAASEEGEEVHTALRAGCSPLQWVLANGKAPTVLPTSEELLFNVEPLSDARTPLADFFSILLGTGRRRQLHFDARVVFINVFIEVGFDDAVVVDAESLTEGILRDLEPAIDVSPQGRSKIEPDG